jgi:D-glycero-D-manno-heptose 1,7-bisphosphate phosphatase
MRPAVFLDRDGTVIDELGYLGDSSRIDVFPWSAAALRDLAGAGFALVIVTNQAGVARGFFDEDTVRAVNASLDQRLRAEGAVVDGYYYCPHHPEGVVERYRMACRCRKPAPGMIEDAARDLGLDVSRSWVVGDTWLDVGLAVQAGSRGILVRTGHGARVEAERPEGVDAAAIVATLGDAARFILAQAAPRR